MLAQKYIFTSSFLNVRSPTIIGAIPRPILLNTVQIPYADPITFGFTTIQIIGQTEVINMQWEIPIRIRGIIPRYEFSWGSEGGIIANIDWANAPRAEEIIQD